MQQRRALTHNGICHLILEVHRPELPGTAAGGRIESFLSAVEATVQTRAEQALPRLAAHYESDPDPRKRFRHRPYLLSLSFEITEPGRYLRMRAVLRLSKSGRTLFEK